MVQLKVQKLAHVGISATGVLSKDSLDLVAAASWYPCLVETLKYLHCACCNCYYYLTVFMFSETAVKPPWRELFSKNLFQQCAVMVAIDDMKHIASMSG